MLRSDLVRLRRLGNGRASLVFATDNDLELAETIIAHLRVGTRLGDAIEDVKVLRRIYDKRLVDGLLQVALKHVELETASHVDPRKLRQFLFSGGPALEDEERRRRLTEASERFGVNAEKAMYADLDIEEVIIKAPDIGAEQLIREYNMEEVEGLLLKANVATFVVDNWKEFLRSVKRLGLMYTAHEGPPTSVDVYGPVSLARMTERYGKYMARLVPVAIKGGRWSLEAEVAVGRARRLYRVRVSSGDAAFPKVEGPEAPTFDSTVEEDLYRKLSAALKGTGIELVREPRPLVTEDGEIVIPDFGVRLGNREAYIEVVGFWTREYVNSKVRKFSALKVPVLLVVNGDLGVEEFRLTGHDIVVYYKEVNVAPIYSWVTSVLRRGSIEGEISLSGDYVSFEDLARAYEVPVDAVRSYDREVKGYVKLRNYFVRESLIKALESERVEGRRLSELSRKFGPWVQEALQMMGYSLRWVSLTDAVVVSRGGPRSQRPRPSGP